MHNSEFHPQPILKNFKRSRILTSIDNEFHNTARLY